MHDVCFYIENFCNKSIISYQTKSEKLDHDKIAATFEKDLLNKTDEEIISILICAGFIPDLYIPDSSEETLFSKLVEVLLAVWAKKMGFKSEYIKQKASYEDVNITICNKVVVCDAKSFRLGRSQKAPNVKDFLKLADIEKWLNRYSNRLGGLITYPDTHEWFSGSDAYQYCTAKRVPTVMLPYKYLALLLYFKNKYNTEDLKELWNYEKLFPVEITKREDNKQCYWKVINKTIENICHITSKDINEFIENANSKIKLCIVANLERLQQHKNEIINHIKEEIANINNKEAKQLLQQYKIEKETENINILCKRIKKFRL